MNKENERGVAYLQINGEPVKTFTPPDYEGEYWVRRFREAGKTQAFNPQNHD